MLVRLINKTWAFRGWQGRLPGAVFEIADGVGNTLIRRGIATLETKPKGRGHAGNRRNTQH